MNLRYIFVLTLILFLQWGCVNLKILFSNEQYLRVQNGKAYFFSADTNVSTLYIYDTFKVVNKKPMQGILLNLNTKLISDKLYCPSAANGSVDSLKLIEFIYYTNSNKRIIINDSILISFNLNRKVQFMDLKSECISIQVGGSNWNNIDTCGHEINTVYLNPTQFIFYFNTFKEQLTSLDEYFFAFFITPETMSQICSSTNRLEIKLGFKNKFTHSRRTIIIQKMFNSHSIDYYEYTNNHRYELKK